ncbi:MAG: MBOAT family protein, partial [Lachnospiraceae bacterium]|nr:MBOAT family protein [Lachnospiraceae bacterium]
MLFSSISFLYYFLPCVLILYLVTPRKLKNFVLLLSSLFFYGWGGVNFLWLMMIMLAAGYIWGLLVGKYREQKIGKWLLGAALGMNVLTLIYFKFADVFPIGISFYTFQIMSYIVDVYRGEVPAQRNPVNFSAYASMFPQLVAGPIVRYADIAKQLESRAHSFDHAALGIRTFVLGLAKKVLIANTLGELCDIFRASNDKAVLFYWLYAAAFTLHIYFDFSGYSDMAVGLGKMFGFDFMDNFNYPYISKSVTEFWRRWHISLSSWFRDYVYIPLGGNRVPKGRWFFNIFVVWFLTGFWHGAAWNFIAWGLGFAIILVIEKMWLLKQLEQSRGAMAQILRHVYVMIIVMISFVLFNATDISEAGTYIASMFGLGDLALVSKEALYYMRS